ncbi:MAG: hypothetical protein ACFFAU_04300 [Candidatus Hodarchaeota archaeon]
MGNCEKCGKIIEDGAVFCKSCTGDFNAKHIQKKADTAELGIEAELFSYKRKHSTFRARFILGFPIILGLLVIVLGITFIIPDFGNFEENSIILPIVITLLSLLIIVQLYRRIKQYPSLFLILTLFILTTGTTIAFPELSNLLLSIGATLSVLIVVTFIFQQYGQKKVLFINLTLMILAFGATIVFPDYSTLILASCLILAGFLLILGKL